MTRKIGEWIADEDTDTLVRGDTRRKLERRAMAVLMELAAKPNQVISKDELIESVWGGVAVSDHSVAIVISQLRRAFGDDRASPAYIETIAKRGYRLIAAVDENAFVEAPAPSIAPPPPPPLPSPKNKGIDRRVLWLGGAAFAAAGVATGVHLFNAKPRYAVAITDFEASQATGAGEAAFALNQLVSTRLFEQIGDRALRWRGATSPDGLAQLRTNARGARDVAVLTGFVFADRGMIVASVQLRDARSGTVLKAAVYPLEGASILAQASAIARDVAQAAGYNVGPGEMGSDLPPEAWARFWEAQYTASAAGAGMRRRARDMLMLLVYDYPNFARARVSLAEVYAYTTPETLGLPGFDTHAAAQEQLDIARRLGGETTDTAIISSFLAFITRRDFNEALIQAERATSLDPSRSDAWQMLALVLSVGGRHDQALAAITRAQELDPASMDIRWDHVFFLYAAERYQQALTEAQAASRVTGPYPLYMAFIYEALGRRGEAFTQWTERARRRGLDEGSIAQARRVGARNPRDGYTALIRSLGRDYRETGVPLAVLHMNAGDSDGAVRALLQEPDVRDRWLSPFVDRIVSLRALRRDPRVAEVFDELEDFRG